MLPSFGQVLNRFRTGEKRSEQDFDLGLFRETERVKAKYDIRCRPDEFVALDDGMADRCFQAGRELYSCVGSYCLDTGTIARFSLDEMDASMAAAPEEVTWGFGDDAFLLRHRPVGSEVPAFVWGGIQTLLFSDEKTARAVYRACCRCRDVHGVWGGIVPRLDGLQEVRGGSPEEILPYRRSAEALRQAAADAGRPGMPVMNGAPLSVTHFSLFAGAKGFRPTDGIETGGIPELKVSLDLLDRAAFALATGTVHSGGLGVVIGGFSGSVEGAAIVAVASAYATRLVNQGRVTVLTATPMKRFTRAGKQGIWVGTLALQALNRNAKLIVGGFMCDHPVAGPGTAQYFYETAAGTIPAIACGSVSWGGTRKFHIGQTLDYGSPVESEFLGRVTRAATGLTPEFADRVARALYEKYENTILDAPQGRTLEDLYDLESGRPQPEYRATYDKVAAELRDLGVPFSDYQSP